MKAEELLQLIEEARSIGRDEKLTKLVKRAQKMGIYPRDTVLRNPNTVLNMVKYYGTRWFEWKEPLSCPYCGVDLRAPEGPPFKREIAIYSQRLDRTVGYRCPDCGKTLSTDPGGPSNKYEIQGSMHCGLCYVELQELNQKADKPQSMADYANAEVGWTPCGIQVWCRRHQANILHIDLDGHQHQMNHTREAL